MDREPDQETPIEPLPPVAEDDDLEIKEPNWVLFSKRRHLPMQDAVALSMNCEPVSLRKAIKNDPAWRKPYNGRKRSTSYEMVDGGLVKVIEKRNSPDKSDWLIDMASFVRFAQHSNWNALSDDFIRIGHTTTTANTTAVNRKAPDKFVAKLICLLVAVGMQAAKNGKPFDPRAMPGTRDDFREFASKASLDFDIPKATFDTYIKGLCLFLPGSRHTDFYATLFNEPPKLD